MECLDFYKYWNKTLHFSKVTTFFAKVDKAVTKWALRHLTVLSQLHLRNFPSLILVLSIQTVK